MLDFKEELTKYKPILDIADIEAAVNENTDDAKDMMDILTHLIKQIVALRPGRPE